MRVACVWAFVAAPLALGWAVDSGPDRFAGVSFVALCGTAWIAAIGMPRRCGAFSPWTQEVAAAALLTVPLAAAAGLDLAQGGGTARTIGLVIAIVACALILGDAARRAAISPRSARMHALAWLALVAGPVLLDYALEVGGAPFLGRAPGIVAWLARASPIGAVFAQVGDVARPLQLTLGGAVTLALVLVVVATAARRPWSRGELA